MRLLEDKAQQDKKHLLKHQYWQETDIQFERVPLPVGDYVLVNDKIQDVIDRKAKRGIELKKMDFLGTYNVCVDTKNSIEELLGDICGPQHERFRDECILAQNNGIKLYILVENKGGLIKNTSVSNQTIFRLEDLHNWKNPRLFLMEWNKSKIKGYSKAGKPIYERRQKFPKATRGITLQKACWTMQQQYGVEFLFCTPEESGAKVIELLRGN